MNRHIHAVIVKDWTHGYEGQPIPVIRTSDHPGFKPRTRFDWGNVQTALKDGWSVTIHPLTPQPHTLRKGCE